MNVNTAVNAEIMSASVARTLLNFGTRPETNGATTDPHPSARTQTVAGAKLQSPECSFEVASLDTCTPLARPTTHAPQCSTNVNRRVVSGKRRVTGYAPSG